MEQIDNWLAASSMRKATYHTREQLEKQVRGLVQIQGHDGMYYVKPEQVEAKLAKYRQAAVEQGKDPKRVYVCRKVE